MLSLLMLVSSWAPPDWLAAQAQAKPLGLPVVLWVSCEPMPMSGVVVGCQGSIFGSAEPCCWVAVLYTDGCYRGEKMDQNVTEADITARIARMQAYRPAVVVPASGGLRGYTPAFRGGNC